MSAGFPQPPVIGAADQPGPAPSVLPPDQGAVADLVQAQQPGLLRVQRRQLRGLGVAALGERGGAGVILGLRLTRPRMQAAAAAEAGGDFQQVRLPQPGQLPPSRRQVPGTGLLASPARPRCRRPRRGKAARMTGQELHAHLLPGPVRPGQQDPAQVRLAELDRPLPAVQHHNGPRRQVRHRPVRPHRRAPGPASRTAELSPSGRDMSMPSFRCRTRCSS
jgi:hypothetical protein